MKLLKDLNLLYLLTMNMPLNTHAARSAMNNDPEVRQWVESWLKDKERSANQAMTIAEFEKHWLYVRPERMHEGALEAFAAYVASSQSRPVS